MSTNQQIVDCAIYKSQRKDFTFLYVEKEDDFEKIPPALLELLGELTHVMNLELHEQRKLANADVLEVMASLKDVGYYLQMPNNDFDPEKLPV